MQYEHGDIIITGKTTVNVVAGRMLICDDGEWREVCDEGWGIEDAQVVCRQLGFNPQSMVQCLQSITNKCTHLVFFRSSLLSRLLLWKIW